MKWRPPFCLLWLTTGIVRYEKDTTGFLLVGPFLISILSLLAAILWWKYPTPRQR